ncbi:AMP-binding protein [Paenibacillus endoradicis]|uniref:AMP-binding protein n=1 Tax=Paenibacillus endoradicis TaxID=2972487 RepID=UPI0021598B8D|nr:AMP-binding protein [Paenibacillus endoradicis]MCR8660527.1 AMP-binding protein [Paenibacillus endoradicis]
MFFENFNYDNKVAIITNDTQYTYEQLHLLTKEYSLHSTQKELVLLLCENNIQFIAAYMAVLQAGHAVMLMGANTNKQLLDSIVTTYQPKWIIGSISFADYVQMGNVSERTLFASYVIHSDLALLLSTSGTTGSQKFVRLSYANLQTNAESIVTYLQIEQDERAILNLPLSYSYGLSILNSHLQAGATVLLTEESVMAKTFWQFVEEHQATSLAGVPFTYQMLSRIGFFKMELPHLKMLTQAGGHLEERLVKLFGEYAEQHNKKFYIMYGQTEAAPRMSYIPTDKLLRKAGSIGIAIPGGQFELAPETNELIYKGANVMLGYAETLDDLAKGDENKGILHTGDVAEVDADGYYTITGRMKRFVKLFGLRINLDDVERKLVSIGEQPVACTGSDDKLVVMIESELLLADVKRCLEKMYKLHHSAYKIIVADAIPRMANGKTDYKAIKDEML